MKSRPLTSRASDFARISAWGRDGISFDGDRFYDAPRGDIYRHEIASRKTEKLGILIPHNDNQSTLLDEERGLLYHTHFTPEWLSVFDLKTGTGRELGPIRGQDADGAGRKFDPRRFGGNLVRLACQQGLAFASRRGWIDGSHGFARVEGLFKLGTGKFFASAGNAKSSLLIPSRKNTKSLKRSRMLTAKPCSSATTLASLRTAFFSRPKEPDLQKALATREGAGLARGYSFQSNKNTNTRVTHEACDQVLSLPLFPTTPPEDVENIGQALRETMAPNTGGSNRNSVLGQGPWRISGSSDLSIRSAASEMEKAA